MNRLGWEAGVLAVVVCLIGVMIAVRLGGESGDDAPANEVASSKPEPQADRQANPEVADISESNEQPELGPERTPEATALRFFKSMPALARKAWTDSRTGSGGASDLLREDYAAEYIEDLSKALTGELVEKIESGMSDEEAKASIDPQKLAKQVGHLAQELIADLQRTGLRQDAAREYAVEVQNFVRLFWRTIGNTIHDK